MTATITEVSTPVVLVEIEATALQSTRSADLSVVEVTTTALPVRVEVVKPSAYLEVIDTAIRGEPGPLGPPGLVKVAHGSNPYVERPVDSEGRPIPLVYWVGSVQPLYADPDDLLMLKS